MAARRHMLEGERTKPDAENGRWKICADQAVHWTFVFHTALAVAAALVGLAFTLSTFDRWLQRRRPHELSWTFAFALFTLAAAFLAAGAQAGWSPAIFRGFYLFGAIANVPLLALGSLLLADRNGSDGIRVATWVAAGFVVFSAGVMVTTPLVGPLPHDELAQGSDVLQPLPRILAAAGSGLGATVVFGGSVWSALRRRQARNVAANGLIATGTAILGMSGVLNSVADAMTAFAITLVVGISVLFAGFLVATSRAVAPALVPVRSRPRQSRAVRRAPHFGRTASRT
jgi:hypothetical protein